MKKKKAFFITFEGPEGCGKTTLITELKRKLKEGGATVTATREPGGPIAAEKIRELILNNPMGAMTELFLYEAARAEHLEKVINPALISHNWVLCDRFTDSTLAYQGYARGLDLKLIKTLNKIATQGIQPNLSVYLDVDPEVGLKRSSDPNRFERESLEFHHRVRNGFLSLIKEDPKRWIRLKAFSSSAEKMAESLIAQLEKRLTGLGRKKSEKSRK